MGLNCTKDISTCWETSASGKMRMLCTWDNRAVPCHVCVTSCQCLRCFRVSDKCSVLSVMSRYVATQARTEYFPRCLKSGNYSSETVRHRQRSGLGEGEGSFLSWCWPDAGSSLLSPLSAHHFGSHLVPRRRDRKVSPSRKSHLHLC